MILSHRLSISSLTATLALLVIGGAGTIEAAVIRLNPRARVTSPMVRLGDVAVVEEADARLLAALNQVVLRPAPAAGRSVDLSFSDIRARLQARGLNLAKCEFRGSSVVTVSVDAVNDASTTASAVKNTVAQKRAQVQQRNAEQRVGKAIENYLRGIVPELGQFRVEIQIDPNAVSSILAPNVSGYHVRGGRAPWNQPQQFIVAFLDRYEQRFEVPVTAQIVVLPKVLAAKHPIQKGRLIQPDDLIWKQVERVQNGLTQPDHVIGSEAKRTIRQGDVIQAAAIQSVPLVRSNDIVRTVSRTGNIRIESYLKARSQGGLGDTVTLISLDGRKQILARVTGLHEAEVVGSSTQQSVVRRNNYRQPRGAVQQASFEIQQASGIR